MYKRVDALDKKYKPLILDWLNKLFNTTNKYNHTFADQWISWTIWNGNLSVSFDLRQVDQQILLSNIHPRFLGCPQSGTLKVVNDKSFYLELSCLLHIQYPEIVSSELIKKNKEKGGKGGWTSDSDDFYTYYWCLNLSDGSSLYIIANHQ